MTDKSLKDGTRLMLYVVMLANLSVFYTIVQHNAIVTGTWLDLLRNGSSALPAGIGLILTGILNAQLSADMKSRIVFLRWRNPLPGCEAFSRHAKEDPRIDLSAIQRLCGNLPEDPREQNSLWYRLYKSVESEPSVAQVHRSFLFARDYACMSLMFAVTLGTLAFFQFSSRGLAVFYFAALAIQFLLASQAARNHAKRFVTTVLSIKAATA
jgi:hypothetical protein